MRRWRIPVGLGIFGVATSALGITVPSVWYDEAATVSAATRTLPQLAEMLGNVDAVHGAYYLLMHVVFGVVGYSPLSLRIASAIAVGIASALVVVLDRQLRPESRGIVAGLVFCLIPRVAWMGGEGRSFALTAAFAALLTVLLLHAITAHSRGRWVVYGMVAFAGCVLFLYFALIVLAHGVTVALNRRRMLVPWALAAGAAGFALIPFVVLVTSERSQLPTMPPLGLQTVEDVLLVQWFGPSILLAILAWTLLTVGLLRNRPMVLPVVLPALVLPTCLLLVGALVNPELYQPRYLGMCTPFLAVGLAAGIGGLRWLALRAVAAAALLVLAVPLSMAERAPDAKKDGTWSDVAAIVASARSDEAGTSTAVVFGKLFPHHGATARVISVAYPSAFDGTIDVTLDVPASEYSQDLWGTWRPLDLALDRLGAADETFLITTASREAPDSDDAVLRADGWMPVHEWHEGGITVVHYVR